MTITGKQATVIALVVLVAGCAIAYKVLGCPFCGDSEGSGAESYSEPDGFES